MVYRPASYELRHMYEGCVKIHEVGKKKKGRGTEWTRERKGKWSIAAVRSTYLTTRAEERPGSSFLAESVGWVEGQLRADRIFVFCKTKRQCILLADLPTPTPYFLRMFLIVGYKAAFSRRFPEYGRPCGKP